MFRQSKRRIRAVMMLVLFTMWGATLLIIYFTTYTKVNEENQEMLKIYADAYDTHGLPKDEQPDFSEKSQFNEENSIPPEKETKTGEDELTHRYEVSTFFAVIFDKNGAVKEYKNQSASGMTDTELIVWAQTVLDNSVNYGVSGNIVYYITTGDDYIMVTMMDNSVAGAAINTLLRYMVLFGGLSMAVLMVLSVILSGWVVKPMEKGYEKQKEFISDAGHELKTPISTIAANLELLKRETGENRWLYNIAYENERMSAIVRELLDLARLENTQMQIEDVDFGRIAMSAILPFEAKAFEKGILLEYEIEEKLIAKGEKRQLEKLVSILVDNAISHGIAEDGANIVKIAANGEKGEVHFIVSNRGKPISREERERLFDRFYREDKARTDEQGHYGLGLAIAKAIVSGCGGKIWVECKEGFVSFHVLLLK